MSTQSVDMSISVICRLLTLCVLCGTSRAIDGLDWCFASDYPHTPRATLVTTDGDIAHQMPIHAFTICVYVKFDDRLNHDVTIFSYATHSTANEAYLELNYDHSYTQVVIGEEVAIFNGKLPKKHEWVHLCVSWTSDTGEVHFYINGEDQTDGNSTVKVNVGYTIKKDGCFVMAQDQDEYNSGFEAADGMTGCMTQVHVWDRVLTNEEVWDAQNCDLAGNVVNWTNGSWSLSEGVRMHPSTAPCYVSCGNTYRDPDPVGKNCTNVKECRINCPANRINACRSGKCRCTECNSLTDCLNKICTDKGKVRSCPDKFCMCKDCSTSIQCELCHKNNKRGTCTNGTCIC